MTIWWRWEETSLSAKEALSNSIQISTLILSFKRGGLISPLQSLTPMNLAAINPNFTIRLSSRSAMPKIRFRETFKWSRIEMIEPRNILRTLKTYTCLEAITSAQWEMVACRTMRPTRISRMRMSVRHTLQLRLTRAFLPKIEGCEVGQRTTKQ